MRLIGCLFSLVIILASCSNQQGRQEDKKPKDSTIRISVDESFEPIIREQIEVFESAYPETRVVADFKPEAECLKDLENDSTKVIIISRELNRNETSVLSSRLEYKPEFDQLAKDAIAVIINKNNPDSVFTLEDIRQLLTGKGKVQLPVAVDGNTATSTVRYLKDSVLKGAGFGTNVTGAKNSGDLIRYISTNPNAIGFVGVSWITNPQTKEQEEQLKSVKAGLIECSINCEKDTYARPSQQTITFGQYPLVRGLYYVLKENYAGLGSRLVFFLTTERGQLIFKRASLVPVMRFDRRTTRITEQ